MADSVDTTLCVDDIQPMADEIPTYGGMIYNSCGIDDIQPAADEILTCGGMIYSLWLMRKGETNGAS